MSLKQIQKLDIMAKLVWRFFGARFFGMRYPLLVGFSLTERCPFKCRYCFFSSARRKDLPFSAVTKVIDTLYEAGMLVVQFTGGEPCLRDDLGDIIKYARGKNLFIVLSSSGYNIQKHQAALNNVDSTFISLDGPKDVHDALRGEGGFDIALEAADFLKERGQKFYFRTVLSALNLRQLDEVIKIAQGYGTQAIFQLLWSPKNEKYANIKDVVPTDNSLNEALEHLMMLKKKYRGVGNTLFTLRSFQRSISRLPMKGPCAAGRIFFRVEANAELVPCCRLDTQVNPAYSLNLIEAPYRDFKDYIKRSGRISCKFCLDGSLAELNSLYNFSLSTIIDNLSNWRLIK